MQAHAMSAPTLPVRAAPLRIEDPKDHVDRLAQLWERNVVLMQEFEAAADALARYEEQLTGGTFSAAQGLVDSTALARVCGSMVHRLVALATEHFSPTGGEPIAIDERALQDELFGDAVDQERWGAIDIQKAWEWLEARYGNGAGIEQSYRKSAKTIVSDFHLYDGDVSERAGRVITNVRVWMDPYENTPALSYQSEERLSELNRALAAFASWAADAETAEGLRNLAGRWRGGFRARAIQSRERISVSGHIDVITYQHRFEYRLTRTLAEQLMVFVSTFGPPRREE